MMPKDDAEQFFSAIVSGDAETVRALLSRKPDLVRREPDRSLTRDGIAGATALHLAVHEGRCEIVRVLGQAGADLNARTSCGRTALHDSIEYGSPATDTLLELGAEVDICAAAILGRIDRVRELLDADAGLANDRATGLSPLGWAAYGNRVEVAELLIERGARMDDGELLCAAAVNGVGVGGVLLRHAVDPDARVGKAGGNALHAACAMKHSRDSTEFVRMLLEAGSDVNTTNHAGKTPLDMALEGAEGGEEKQGAYRRIADLLRRNGARRAAEL